MTENNFKVFWTIDNDFSNSPGSAAAAALDSMRSAAIGDSGAANCFVVVDRNRDQIHTVDLGYSCDVHDTVVTIWPRPQGQRFEPRLGPVDARVMVNAIGEIELNVRIDQQTYLEGHAMFLSGSDGDDHLDQIHHSALSFGSPRNADATIVSVDNDDFIVTYRTDLSTFFTPTPRG